MALKNNIKRLCKDTKGAIATTEMLFVIIAVFTIFISLLYIMTIIPNAITLKSQAEQLAKVCEVAGGIGAETNAALNELKSSSDIDSVTWEADKWVDSGKTKIPLHTQFTVTLNRNIKIPILNIGEHYPITVNLKAVASGLSEVYYKP